MNKYYIIQASNGSYYTENHISGNGEDWSSEIAEAHRFATYADAEYEISIENFPVGQIMFIREIIVK